MVTNPGEGTPNRLLYTGGPARDFTVALGSAAATLLTGTEQTVRIDLAQVGEGRQRVRLAVSGVPDGVTATFSSAAVDTWENRSAALTLKADTGATPGTAAITVTAVGSDVTRSAILGLTVVAPELAVSLSDTAGTARPGTSLVTTVRSKVVAGSFSYLSLSVAGLPAGVRLGGGTGTGMWPGDTSKLWFVVGSDAEPGAYPVTVTTSSGPVKAPATHTLTVTGEPGACGSYDTPGIEVLGDSTENATITVSGCGRNAGAESRVTVSANRPYPEATDEVAIDLIAPDGSVHPLKAARTHDDNPEYVDSYSVDLSGVAADGEWQLRVHNGAEFWLDTIQINGWMLAL